MREEHCDVGIVGGGPGGYTAAIRLAQKGKKVLLIERNSLGGCCLNVGCIPTKIYTSFAQTLRTLRKASEVGIHCSPTFDFAAVFKQKEDLVSKLRTNVRQLLSLNGVSLIEGSAKLLSPKKILVSAQEPITIHCSSLILAPGSEAIESSSFPCDANSILNSTSFLQLTKLPQKVALIGGGYIGCEFASFLAELGIEVLLIEDASTLLPSQDKTISSLLTKEFTKRSIRVLTQKKVERVEKRGQKISLYLSDQSSFEVDLVLSCIGRRPATQDLGLEEVGIALGPKKEIIVNEHMETSLPHVYAIGDATGLVMLAHVASHQGLVAADHLLGNHSASMDYRAIPSVIFTTPEIASVGLTLEQAQKVGSAKLSSFPFKAIGKAHVAGEKEGFAQIVFSPETGQILGAHLIGSEASLLIAEMTLAIQKNLTIQDLCETIHAHPTLSEIWGENALLASGFPIHLPQEKKSP